VNIVNRHTYENIDEFSEMMNYGMLACNWLYDDDNVMNNG